MYYYEHTHRLVNIRLSINLYAFKTSNTGTNVETIPINQHFPKTKTKMCCFEIMISQLNIYIMPSKKQHNTI